MLYPETQSLVTRPKKLIVLVHGIGSDGHDLISLVPFMQQDLPDCHFISPHGIEDYDMAPFGKQWFSLQDRSTNILQLLMSKSATELQEIINCKQNELKLTNSDTILIGFSQGGMLCLYLTLTSIKPFYGMVGFSCALIPPPEVLNTATPVCLVHGSEDEVIEVKAMQTASRYLKAKNINCKAYEIPKLKHSIDAAGINLAIDFIKSRISHESHDKLN